jgi:hypothetical protein
MSPTHNLPVPVVEGQQGYFVSPQPRRLSCGGVGIALVLLMLGGCSSPDAVSRRGSLAQLDAPWTRHAIDNSSEGADGTRLADANGDGLPDIVTGWEEGGLVRAYLHPGHDAVRQAWPRVTIGQVASPEDAVFADFDRDGNLDVLTSTEGRSRQLFVHWGPGPQHYLDEASWETQPIPAAKDAMQWMFALPAQIDGQHGEDLFAGGKNEDAAVGWLQVPDNARDLAAWRWHPLRPVGWLMSLVAADMDGDGDADLLLTDRRGERSGLLWLENPGPEAATGPWVEHNIGNVGQHEVMFLSTGDLDGDGLEDIVVAVKPRELHLYRLLDSRGSFAEPQIVPLPEEAGSAKGIAIGDMDQDGIADLVFSCEHAVDGKQGVMGLRGIRDRDTIRYEPFPISGPEGVKFDLIELLDLDGDGDLDVLTCEENENLGVIWYENPLRP